MNKLIIPFLLFIAFLAVGCSDDEPKDAVREIRMSVSSETGTRYVFGSEQPVECMLVMSEDNPGVWEPFDFNAIKGFTYENPELLPQQKQSCHQTSKQFYPAFHQSQVIPTWDRYHLQP